MAVVSGGIHYGGRHPRLLALLGFTLSGSKEMTDPRRKLRRANRRVRIEDERWMPLQFSLRRLFGLVTIAAVVCSLFATVEWHSGMALLAGMNLIACIGFLSVRRWLLSGLAGVTTLLILMAIMLDSHPFASSFEGWVASLVWAGILQCVTLVCWLFSASPPPGAKN
jgi:hypothetical protein